MQALRNYMVDLSLKDFLAQLAVERGLELRGYKYSTLDRRIRRRMFQLKIGNLGEYIEFVGENPGETNELLNTILINVTEFFRDPPAWEVLRKNIVPRLTRDLRPGGSFRIWSAGCASGEEAYSAAIAIAEHFGPKIQDYDIKIYATDIDEDALNTARRAEYPAKSVQRLPQELREKYFTGEKLVRISRDLRRLVVFGRSNFSSDAPISHIKLLICRNALIYFDSAAQENIMRRLHYALDPGGVLFLGRSESQLRNASLFRPIDSKWRFFERIDPVSHEKETAMPGQPEDILRTKTHEEFSLLKLYYNALLQTLDPGIVVLDATDVIMIENQAALALLRLSGKKLVGKPLAESELAAHFPDLVSKVESTRPSNAEARLECSASNDHKIALTIRPIMAEKNKGRAGTLICMEDVTHKEKLQSTIEALETTSEELQAANEELETTNEELQSANEELETTNEELQSTNEELETTNEELQSLNEELETTNEEMDLRGKELDASNARYSETLENLPWPMMLMDRDQNIVIWNTAARKLFGFETTSTVGLNLSRLPIPKETSNALLRRYRSALIKTKSVVAKSVTLKGTSARDHMNIYFRPMAKDEFGSVLVMFTPAFTGSQGNSKQHTLKSNPGKKSKAARNSTRRTKKQK
ncbi:MAG TPA: CheR family methyltransferase [Terriglobales bacterium]|jgi:two-component system CheB/CheR fusion protein|nr:CheR family methyltransferase [Terriglobales bacterium]